MMRWFAVFVLGAGLLPAQTRQFDLVVYGATASGIATAVAGSREGLRVALVDPGHHLGGMVAGGLSRSDHGDKAVIGGISREFFERVGKHYDEPIEWYFEPHVAEQVFREMLQEAHVEFFRDSRIKESGGVIKHGTHITEFLTESGQRFRAAIFADCTYEGDLMGFAGVRYTWGRESSGQYGESAAGVRGRQRPDHHFNVRVSPYDSKGQLLPEVYAGPKGQLGEGDKKVQAYGFRMCLTDQRGNLVTYPEPPGYNPYRYELLARLLQAETKAKGHAPAMRDAMIMSDLKGGKFDINSFGGFSTDHIGASWGYPTASYQQRAAIWQDHYNYDAGFFYFLSHDSKVPKALQDEVNRYGLARDEFVDNHNWPWQLYVRESRRMLGEYIMTQKDIQADLEKTDSIGMGSYESDSHHMQRVPTKDGAVENEGEMYIPVKPYEIPYRMILPKREQATNLLVPVCFSASHAAYSTLRMEPQYMIIGQAAGVAAWLALRAHCDLQKIDVHTLQKKLAAEKAVLHLPSS